MWLGVVDGLWFFLPVLLGNVAVFLLGTVFGQTLSIDLGKSLGANRIIGDSRDLAGALTWILVSGWVGYLQGRGEVGIVLGVGGFIGVVVNSFLKRRLGIKSGSSFMPLDQIDFTLGSTLVYSASYAVDWAIIGAGILAAAILHLVTNIVFRPRMDKWLTASKAI